MHSSLKNQYITCNVLSPASNNTMAQSIVLQIKGFNLRYFSNSLLWQIKLTRQLTVETKEYLFLKFTVSSFIAIILQNVHDVVNLEITN